MLFKGVAVTTPFNKKGMERDFKNAEHVLNQCPGIQAVKQNTPSRVPHHEPLLGCFGNTGFLYMKIGLQTHIRIFLPPFADFTDKSLYSRVLVTAHYFKLNFLPPFLQQPFKPYSTLVVYTFHPFPRSLLPLRILIEILCHFVMKLPLFLSETNIFFK